MAYKYIQTKYKHIRVTYEWHARNIEYIQLTYKLLTTGMRITQEILNRKNVFGAFRS